jgi:phosphohistidine phosphatase SixA
MLRQWTLPAPELRLSPVLAPGSSSKKLARLLRSLKEQSIGLVGHMPDLAEHAAWLIGSSKTQLDFAKAGVAHIVLADKPRKRGGTLVWLVTPEWLEK